MNNDERIAIRLPKRLAEALERERRRVAKVAGAEVKKSAIVRAILERVLLGRAGGA